MGRALIAMVAAAAASSAPASAADYFKAPFKETVNQYAYGQAPVFLPGGKRVAFGKDFKKGAANQVYIADFPNGAHLRCLTCTGPGSSKDNVNGVPVVRPQGDWILFHSWRGHTFTFGSPGYGGFGSALWVMRPDGSHQTQLTEVPPPGSSNSEEGFDDYHAYWSPDGKQIEWAHFDGNIPTGGIGKWDIELGNFVVRHGKAMITDIRVVRPANGHWYETQWWAPDGSGFLYTETTNGTDNPNLFFCRLIDHDRACKVRQLTKSPAWDEQALFTPDMKDVIFMSSRDQPGLFNTWSQTAQTLGLPNDYDWLLIAPLFEAGFLQPVGQEYTDLYMVNLASGRIRRLTFDGSDGWITPEFTWDPKNRFLMWTENRFPNGYRYPLGATPAGYAQALKQLAGSPYVPSSDLTPSGVGVAPLPVQQRTVIGRFALARSVGRNRARHGARRGRRTHRGAPRFTG